MCIFLLVVACYILNNRHTKAIYLYETIFARKLYHSISKKTAMADPELSNQFKQPLFILSIAQERNEIKKNFMSGTLMKKRSPSPIRDLHS